MTAVRFKQYQIKRNGLKGTAISMPKKQLEMMGLGIGDTIGFYTGVMNGLPVVIMANTDAPIIMEGSDSHQGKDLAKYMEANR